MPRNNVSDTIPVTFSPDELRAAISMIDDQLFRVKYIDPKLPGHHTDKARLEAAEAALEILKTAGKHYLRPNEHGSSQFRLPPKAATTTSRTAPVLVARKRHNA